MGIIWFLKINVTLILTPTCFVQTVALMKISNIQLLSKDCYFKFYSWQDAALLISSAELFCSSTEDKQHCAQVPLGNSAFLSPQAHCRETSAQSTHREPCAGTSLGTLASCMKSHKGSIQSEWAKGILPWLFLLCLSDEMGQ